MTAEFDGDRAVEFLQPRRPRVVPHRLLARAAACRGWAWHHCKGGNAEAAGSMEVVPQLDDILDRLHVVSLPMRVRFRGITVREVALDRGAGGLGRVRCIPRIRAARGGACGWRRPSKPRTRRRPTSGATAYPSTRPCPPSRQTQVPEVLARFPRRAHREGQSGRARPDSGRRRGARQRRSRAGVDGAGRRQRRLERRRGRRGGRRVDRGRPTRVPRAAVRDGARAGRAAAPGRRADRRRREHPQGRRPAARRA